MAERKFFKTLITVEVLSEDAPVGDDISLDDLHNMITDGDWSGRMEIAKVEELTPQQAATALTEQGSDPEFFGLNADGSEAS